MASRNSARAEQPVEPPLRGCVVADLSTGIAGGYCTKLLRDGGAEVVKLEPPEGDSLRRWSASGAEIADDRDGALFGFLAGGKAGVVADPNVPADLDLVDAVLAAADVVIWSPGSRLAEHPRFAPAAVRRAHR
ncbi:CoA transferase, partial [Nocardia wallacei]